MDRTLLASLSVLAVAGLAALGVQVTEDERAALVEAAAVVAGAVAGAVATVRAIVLRNRAKRGE